MAKWVYGHFNDGKEKWQSHEMRLMLIDDDNDKLETTPSLEDMCGYGRNEMEAKNELIKQIQEHIEEMKQLEEAVMSDSVKIVEVDCFGRLV